MLYTLPASSGASQKNVYEDLVTGNLIYENTSNSRFQIVSVDKNTWTASIDRLKQHGYVEVWK